MRKLVQLLPIAVLIALGIAGCEKGPLNPPTPDPNGGFAVTAVAACDCGLNTHVTLSWEKANGTYPDAFVRLFAPTGPAGQYNCPVMTTEGSCESTLQLMGGDWYDPVLRVGTLGLPGTRLQWPFPPCPNCP